MSQYFFTDTDRIFLVMFAQLCEANQFLLRKIADVAQGTGKTIILYYRNLEIGNVIL